MTQSSRAVFLSYASQDADSARRICEALRAGGADVWFDQSELRGGDPWDRQIRQQIHDCALFIPVISANTQSRLEGYFRREWKLAVDRTHDMADAKPFLVPVVIDDTKDQEAEVPESFRSLQWTRLPHGETPAAFVERVLRLLSPGAHIARAPAGAARPAGTSRRSRLALLLTGGAVISGVGYYMVDRSFLSKSPLNVAAPTTILISHDAAPTAFTPPAHSVAVLPFTNLSGDPNQEYLSDGLSEELLNALARIDGLQVAARTSSFSFKGKDVDIATIARKLNVGAILEGSIRQSARKVRVTAQLINASTGFHLWSQTYDDELSDVLNLQTKIAIAVASQLDVALSGNALAKIGQGGTRSAAAFDAYLRGSHALAHADGLADYRRAVAAFDEAISSDPGFAAAYALRATALTDISVDTQDLTLLPSIREKARQSAEKAVALAPELAEAYETRGFVRAVGLLDFGAAGPDFARALSLAPDNALVQKGAASYYSFIGRQDAAIAASARAVELDPENHAVRHNHILALAIGRQYAEALRAVDDYKAAGGTDSMSEVIGGIYLAMGQPEIARTFCESTRVSPDPAYTCLAMAYHALGNETKAEEALRALRATSGDRGAFQYAEVYAQWGNIPEALKWLEAAARLRVPPIQNLRSDWTLDPVRNEPAFERIERQFHFPTD